MVRVPTASTSILSDSGSSSSGGDDTSTQLQDQSIILRDSSNSRSRSGISINNRFGGSGGSSNGITSTTFSDNETNNDDGNGDDDDKIVEQIHFDEAAIETALAQSTQYVWATFEQHKEFVLGACAALTVFLTVILAFLVNRRRKSRQNNDKAPLVDNEVSVNVDVDRLTIHV